MGQYYKPIMLDNDNEIVAWFYSHDFGNGLKLMEHSFIGNDFVSAIESALTPGKPQHKSRVVWSGDYSDVENDKDVNLYGLCNDNQKVMPMDISFRVEVEEYPYLVNHTKKQYVDKRLMPSFGDKEDPWFIHPLPLLTCEGNGMGGGDYNPKYTKNDSELVGTWARDVISVESSIDEYKDFKQIKPKFKESW